MRTFWLLIAGSIPTLLLAGPLDPPFPPDFPTPPLEPRQGVPALPFLPIIISEPGSYYLTQNLLDVTGLNAIQITANDVELDLNGFTVAGATSPEFSRETGIDVTGSGVTVRNGTLRDWRYSGLLCTGEDGLFTDLHLIDCSNFGLRAGSTSTVRDCRATRCGTAADGAGFSLGSSCQILNSRVRGGAGIGIHAGLSCVIENCLVVDSGRDGIATAEFSAIRDCTVRIAGDNGISVTTSCHVTGNNVSACVNPDTGGISAGANNRIENNTLTNNLHGVYLREGGNVIVRNVFQQNSFVYYVVPTTADNFFGTIMNRNGTVLAPNAGPAADPAFANIVGIFFP